MSGTLYEVADPETGERIAGGFGSMTEAVLFGLGLPPATAWEARPSKTELTGKGSAILQEK